MTGLDLITLAVAVLAVGGLAVVLGEALVKNPRSLLEMATDSQKFAEGPQPNEAPRGARRTIVETTAPAANANRPRLAA